MPARARPLSEADQALWASYVQQLSPLPGRSQRQPAQPQEPPDPSPPRAKTAPPSKRQQVNVPGPMAAPLAVGTQPGGLDKATWRRFQTGKLSTARTLDLHGMTANRAFHALVSFLRTAHAEQVRCVEIVTGRGRGESGNGGSGVIRRELPHWLNLPEIRPLILGAAHPHALNPGSVRLILRRIR